jgi:hypothetical protein
MNWRIGAARVGAWEAVGSALLDARVMTIWSKGIDFFASFIHEPLMEGPGATRGGKRKPFLEARG